MSKTGPNEKLKREGYQLRFWFVGVHPIIWRRFLFRADSTFADLHYAIQISCNWSDDFLHQFKIHGQTIGVPRAHGLWYSKSAGQVRLSDFQPKVNERFLYEYNFFDNWQLEIRVEERFTLDTERTYPVCIGGKRAAPPEDCGGPEVFNRLRKHFSPFYIYNQLVEYYEMYQRRDELTEDKLYELENRQQGLHELGYWARIDKFNRRTVNKRLKQYATNDDSWREVERKM
ncbi:MAG: plasmid pRiA4b ORF-3 family protein [Candidatus Promineifilaceae bacterium]